MAIKKKDIEFFGVKYRIRQFSAVSGFEMLDLAEEFDPVLTLQNTSVIQDGFEYELDRESIGIFVKDAANVLSPLMVLRTLMGFVNEFNFQFLDYWRGVRIPARFIEGGRSVSSKYTKPVVSQLVSTGTASLKQLEEYYSLEDAFKMFDILTAKSVNEALANEAAQKAK